jgi:gamma-glutamylcyclotransferase (GGCT)/AIG2-like uncharacterized protein YtfP
LLSPSGSHLNCVWLLAQEQYNYRADMTYLGTERTPGYALHDLGVGFPAATIDPRYELIVDVMSVSYRTFARLDAMETAAGYTLNAAWTTRGTTFMWTMEPRRLQTWYPTAKRVESGDWAKYLGAQHAPK